MKKERFGSWISMDNTDYELRRVDYEEIWHPPYDNILDSPPVVDALVQRTIERANEQTHKLLSKFQKDMEMLSSFSGGSDGQ